VCIQKEDFRRGFFSQCFLFCPPRAQTDPRAPLAREPTPTGACAVSPSHAHQHSRRDDGPGPGRAAGLASAVLAHNLNLPFPPGAHALLFSAALTLGVALSGARVADGPSLVAPERPPPPPAAAAAPERRQPQRPQRPPPPPPPAERNPVSPQAVPPRPAWAVPPRTARLLIDKTSFGGQQYLPK